MQLCRIDSCSKASVLLNPSPSKIRLELRKCSVRSTIARSKIKLLARFSAASMDSVMFSQMKASAISEIKLDPKFKNCIWEPSKWDPIYEGPKDCTRLWPRSRLVSAESIEWCSIANLPTNPMGWKGASNLSNLEFGKLCAIDAAPARVNSPEL